MKAHKIVSGVLSALVAACTTSNCQQLPPSPSNSDGAAIIVVQVDASGQATLLCSKLQSMTCQEGQATDCVQTFSKVLADNSIRGFSVPCILGASTKAAEAQCPGIQCP
jgi:hypothetical protein